MREEERDQVLSMHVQTFNFPSSLPDRYRSAPVDSVRILTDNNRVRAALHIFPFGQIFGSQVVSCAGIGGVKVSPEARGKGFGSILMKATLSELRCGGKAISTLYPTNPGIYRRMGYELAGKLTQFQIPLPAVPRVDEDVTVEPWDEKTLPDIVESYRGFARQSNGLLERPLHWWTERVLAHSERPVYKYLARRRGVITGYLIYVQEPEPGDLPYCFSIACRDLVWHDCQSARAMLAFAGSHRGLGKNLFWYAPAENPLALLLNQDVVRVRWSYPWMTRLVCVTEALQGRGYPQSLKAALELQVTDSVLPENDGPIRVEVCDGVARVTPVKNASARVDVGILSAMYTGWLPASDAVRLGRLENATSQEIATIEAMFAGPKPWLGEMF